MRRPLGMVCLVYVITVFLSVFFHPPFAADEKSCDGKTVRLAGKVYQKEHRLSLSGKEEFIIYLNQTAVSGESIPTLSEKEKIKGVACYMAEESNVPIGCMVAVEGKLQEFMHASNPGEFDSREYYQILKLDYKLKDAVILKQSEQYNKLQEICYQIKEFLAEVLEQNFDGSDAGIMKAVLLGDKSSLEDEIKELYKRSGILHIMAISGLHISMLGMGLYRGLKYLRIPDMAAAALCTATMWCYGSMTGMSVSACRAIFMFGMKMGAEMTGRTYDMLTALSLSAVLILTEQPLYVKHSGFLLSFGAVLGIGVVLPFLEKIFDSGWKKTGVRIKLKKGILAGTAIFLVTFPIQICFYYQYCIYSLFLNLLIVPLMTFVMISGLAVLLLGTLESAVFFAAGGIGSQAAAAVGHFILKVYTFSCEGIEKLPGTVWITGCPKAWKIVIYYGILSGGMLFFYWKKRKIPQKKSIAGKKSEARFWRFVYTALFAAGIGVLTLSIESGMEITFLDVGQGDCIYLRGERGGRYLIDGGSTSKSKVGKYQITPFLKSSGVSSLDMVFVSHGDKDHYSGIEELLENTDEDRIRIKCLVLPVSEKEEQRAAGQKAEKESGEEKTAEEGCGRLKQLAAAQGIPVRYMQAGDTIRAGKVEMECLNPESSQSGEKTDGEDKNEQSEVLYLTYLDFSALFTGDITGEEEKEMEKRLMEATGGKRLTLLKVAHHGSMYSTDAEFLEMTKPVFSVISCGRKNRYGHPHRELLERLEEKGTEVYNTARDGAVTVWTDGKRVKIKRFCRQYPALDWNVGKD